MSTNVSLSPVYPVMLNMTFPMFLHITAASSVLSFFTILICSFGLVGNGIVFWLLFFRLKKTQATVYSLHLAVSDTVYLLGCFVITAHYLWLLQTETKSNVDLLGIAIKSDTIIYLGFHCSLFLLTTFSAERCVSVCFPIWYRCKRPQNLSSINCAVIWAMSLLITVMTKYVLFDEYYILALICICVLYILASLIMIFSSFVLVIEVQKRSEACRPIKLYIVIVATVVSFFVYLASVELVAVMMDFGFIRFSEFMYLVFFFMSYLCSSINACANPYIYILVGSWGKKSTIKKALERVFKEEQMENSSV